MSSCMPTCAACANLPAVMQRHPEGRPGLTRGQSVHGYGKKRTRRRAQPGSKRWRSFPNVRAGTDLIHFSFAC
eukprot:28094-Eustigmatos_ZCMA.PRE.1